MTLLKPTRGGDVVAKYVNASQSMWAEQHAAASCRKAASVQLASQREPSSSSQGGVFNEMQSLHASARTHWNCVLTTPAHCTLTRFCLIREFAKRSYPSIAEVKPIPKDARRMSTPMCIDRYGRPATESSSTLAHSVHRCVH